MDPQLTEEQSNILKGNFLGGRFMSCFFIFILLAMSTWFYSCSASPGIDPVAGGLSLPRAIVYAIACALILLAWILVRGPGRRMLAEKMLEGGPEEPFGTALFACIMTNLIACILCLFVCAAGFILSFINKSTIDFYILASLAFITIVINFPRLSDWKTVIAEQQNRATNY